MQKTKNFQLRDTQHIVDTLREAGAKVDFTVFPEGDHFIADEVYSNPTLQQWLVSQSRRQPSVVS